MLQLLKHVRRRVANSASVLLIRISMPATGQLFVHAGRSEIGCAGSLALFEARGQRCDHAAASVRCAC